jgi:hypothetical protein
VEGGGKPGGVENWPRAIATKEKICGDVLPNIVGIKIITSTGEMPRGTPDFAGISRRLRVESKKHAARPRYSQLTLREVGAK